MSVKTTLFYSPNFNLKKRKKKEIKFLIYHYTGMRNENISIKRLTQIQSEVSCHYFIRKNGEIISMVPDYYSAWHAGVSEWGKYKSLNKNSIGIELSNPGHEYGYVNFTKKQIKSLIKISSYLINKFSIKKNFILGHSDIAPDRKIDPGEKFPWKYLSSKKIGIWHKLDDKKLYLLRNKKVSKKTSYLFLKYLKKFGYPNKSKIIKNKKKFINLVTKSFQRRYRPQLINGKIDKECIEILNKLINI